MDFRKTLSSALVVSFLAVSSLVFSGEVMAADKSTTSDPNSKKYYNNDPTGNKLVTPAVKEAIGKNYPSLDLSKPLTETAIKEAQAKAFGKDPASCPECDGKLWPETIKALQKPSGSADSPATPRSAGGLNKDGTIASSSWTLDVDENSVSNYNYGDGPKGNLTFLLSRITNLLLIAIATLAALLIAVAGFRMAISSGNTDEASKGKTMLRYNIMALAIGLCSYFILNLVSWIISA